MALFDPAKHEARVTRPPLTHTAWPNAPAHTRIPDDYTSIDRKAATPTRNGAKQKGKWNTAAVLLSLAAGVSEALFPLIGADTARSPTCPSRGGARTPRDSGPRVPLALRDRDERKANTPACYSAGGGVGGSICLPADRLRVSVRRAVAESLHRGTVVVNASCMESAAHQSPVPMPVVRRLGFRHRRVAAGSCSLPSENKLGAVLCSCLVPSQVV